MPVYRGWESVCWSSLLRIPNGATAAFPGDYNTSKCHRTTSGSATRTAQKPHDTRTAVVAAGKARYLTHRFFNSMWVDSVAENYIFVSGGAHEHSTSSVHSGVASVIESHLSTL
ncbi:hypothetical protein E2C01_063924 [Portunus trituberculatus]|uniref:Uncharacterized protein n=1 Tax=Portunus trituberculatus TaxID=210409 RepID=A0A5B7HHR1_PORTR|nr:hypothetical protein [Portunus trituberculatus]